MRHQKKGHRLGRTHAHRKATLAALSNALIKHKRITTTVSKAKALRAYVEPLIHRARVDDTHNRRQVFRYLQDKETIKVLFGEVAAELGSRPGGYTRVVKLGAREGDAAEMAIIELVDYNDVAPEGGAKAKKARRTRRGRRTEGKVAAPAAAAPKAETPKQPEAPKAPEGPAPDGSETQPEVIPDEQHQPPVEPAEGPREDEPKKD